MSNNPTPTNNKESSEMKREGRQHGMVRTVPAPWGVYPIPPDRGLVNRLDSPPTAGMLKVARKPIIHTKFTSRHHGRQRCLCCHDHPVCKSKDKVKEGTQKMKNGSGGDGSDIRLVSLRVVDSRPGLHISGLSDHLDDVGKNDVDDHVDEGEDGGGDKNRLTGDTEIGSGEIKGDDDDDKISFCDVLEEVIDEDEDEDEGWCLVG